MRKSVWNTAENIWQDLRCWKCDEMWSSVFDTLILYTSAPIFSIETKLGEKGDLRLQHLCQIRSDIQTPSQLWFTLFKLNELLTSLRKWFEKASASEFLRDIYWALFDVKSKNNERCTRLHYVALNVHSGKNGNYHNELYRKKKITTGFGRWSVTIQTL